MQVVYTVCINLKLQRIVLKRNGLNYELSVLEMSTLKPNSIVSKRYRKTALKVTSLFVSCLTSYDICYEKQKANFE